MRIWPGQLYGVPYRLMVGAEALLSRQMYGASLAESIACYAGFMEQKSAWTQECSD